MRGNVGLYSVFPGTPTTPALTERWKRKGSLRIGLAIFDSRVKIKTKIVMDTTEFMISHEIERQISDMKMDLAVNDEGAFEAESGDKTRVATYVLR
ncbi:hypothetical protein J6590_049318 [Homalodisca vitripennis]|nr:hypothetical protein J6590_049318 [Homalodisca vitripennis]